MKPINKEHMKIALLALSIPSIISLGIFLALQASKEAVPRKCVLEYCDTGSMMLVRRGDAPPKLTLVQKCKCEKYK